MKQRIQGIIVGFLIAALVFGSITTVMAVSKPKSIDVYYDNYKIYVDGALFMAKDKNGIIEPFSYNGWIYAPFEFIANALGKSITWDGKTNSLYINSNSGGGSSAATVSPAATSFYDAVPPYDVSSGNVKMVNSVTMGGTVYNGAITYSGAGKNYSLHNLGGKYQKVTGYIGHVDGTTINNSTFNFYGDGKLLASYDMKEDDFPKQVTIDVTGVTQLKIEVKNWTFAFAGTTIE